MDDDDDDNSKQMVKSKILYENCTMSGEETETSSHKQEQFEKGDSSEGCSDVESSFNKAIKVNTWTFELYIPANDITIILLLFSNSVLITMLRNGK